MEAIPRECRRQTTEPLRRRRMMDCLDESRLNVGGFDQLRRSPTGWRESDALSCAEVFDGHYLVLAVCVNPDAGTVCGWRCVRAFFAMGVTGLSPDVRASTKGSGCCSGTSVSPNSIKSRTGASEGWTEHFFDFCEGFDVARQRSAGQRHCRARVVLMLPAASYGA